MRSWLSVAGSFHIRDNFFFSAFFKHFFQMTCIVCFVSFKIRCGMAVCPSVCECKWTDGKETVSCKNTNLSEIPNNLDPGVLILDFNGNNLITLRSDAFNSAGLLNLQRIYLVKCWIKVVDQNAFRSLKNLIYLDLSHNLLFHVPSHSFPEIPELRELKLNGNPILKITGNAFTQLPHLRRLDISECRIGYVEITAFSGLENSLERLKLDRNRITNVQPAAFTLLHALHGIELQNNPWNCSCIIRPLRHWLLQRTVPLGPPPVCRYPPDNANKTWDELAPEDFACVPHISALQTNVDTFEGENVTLSCRMSGSPSPKSRWTLRNRVLLNGNYEYPVTNKKPYVTHSVSVGYTNLTILSLELQDSGIYVCIAENVAGKSIAQLKLTVHTKQQATFVTEKVVTIGIFLIVVITIFLCSIILVIRIMDNKNVVPDEVENRNRFVPEKVETIQSSIIENEPIINPVTTASVTNHKTESSVSFKRTVDVDTERCPFWQDGSSDYEKPPTSKPNDSPRNSIFDSHIGEMALQHHVLHKKELPTGKLYTTAMSFLQEDSSINYPPVARNDGSIPTRKPQRSNTMPRSYAVNHSQRERRDYYPPVSESQSSLLKNYHGGSHSDFVSSPPSSRRYQTKSEYRSYPNENVPSYSGRIAKNSRNDYQTENSSPLSSTVQRSKERYNSSDRMCTKETPLLNMYKRSHNPQYNNYSSTYSHPSTSSLASTSMASTTYDYHAAQLERFLDEYRQIHSELTKMKESCEKLSQNRSREKIISSKNSLERSVSFVPELKDSSIRTASDENFVPKSILKKSQYPYHDFYLRDDPSDYRPNTSPLRRKRYRRFSNSSVDEYIS